MKVKLDKVLGVIRESDEAALGGAFVYGYDNDTAVTSGANQFKRVVLNQDNASYTYVDGFTQMPCHGKVRPCVMSDCSTRTVAYYLNPSDITKKVDGTASKLDGTDGDVMVEFEPCYYRIDQYTDGNSHLHEVFLMSVESFPGAAYWPGFYIGPGGATVRKQYVGMYQGYITGGKLHSWSGVQPTVSTSCANFINAGVANGGNQVNDLMFQWIFHLMITELASCDSQTAVSRGHVDMSGSWQASWVRKTGRADSVPYKGGVLADDADVDSDLVSSWASGAAHVIACKYAYIENLWGSVWENCSGYQKYQDGTEIDITVNSVKYYRYEDGDYPSGEGVTRTAFAWKSEGGTVIYTAAAHPAVNNATYSDTALETSTGYTISAFDEDFTQSGYWFTTDTAKYSQLTSNRDPGPENSAFPAAGCTPDSIAWVSHNWPKAEGWPSKWDARTLFPTNASGGAAGTGLTDYFYNNVQGGARALLRGGDAHYGSLAGFGDVLVYHSVGYSTTYFGGRLSA